MKYFFRPTLQDIADKAKVSRMTVSRVFNGKNNVSQKKQDKIIKIAEDIGYHPNLVARSLSVQSSKTIGVFVPKVENLFFDTYITQILSGISDVTQKLNYRIMFFPIDYNKEKKNMYVSIARSNLVDGIILLKTKIHDQGLENLARINFPFIMVNHRSRSSKYNFVDTRNVKGGEIAVKYLYGLGHRKIAFVAGSMDETNAIDRLTGYKKALKYLGLPYRKEWVIFGDFSKEKAYNVSEGLLNSRKLPTAIFCSDDYMAIGIIDRIKEKGLSVAKDISVVGFDDIEISTYLNPSLTTIRQPIYEIGKRSAELLLDLINKKRNPPIHELLDVELIIRNSVSKLK